MNRYPGEGNRFVICDVCGGKFRVKDTVRITDKYNTLNQMIVCLKDVEKTQPGLTPYPKISEKILSDPSYVRTEPDDVYADNLTANQLPSAPKNGSANVHPVNATILLTWNGPERMGSGRLIGYSITRAFPQLSAEVILEDNTYSEATSFVDITSDITEESSYRVAAITEFGTGPYSEPFYWPKRTVDWEDIAYLITSDTNAIIKTGDGFYIRLNY